MRSTGIEQLQHAIAAVAAVAANTTLDRDELITLTTLARQIDATLAAAVANFDTAGSWALDGSRSMAAWLETHTALTPRESHQLVRRGRFSQQCPLTTSKWADGAIATDKVDRIAALRRHAHDDDAFATFEPTLLNVAVHGTATDLAAVIGQWRDALDAHHQDDIATLAQRQTEREHLLVSETYGGMGVLHGEFAPEHREQIDTALDREIERIRTTEDPRTISQLRAEALVSIMRSYNSQTINASTNRPHISIHVDLPTWNASAIGHCQTSRNRPLSRDTLGRVACNADISVITHDDNRIPLDMYRASRTFTKHQRRALEYRDTTCRYPGCDQPAHSTEAHHIDWWELGGNTNIENAVLLCHYHHRLIHEGRWTIKMDGNATIKWFKPDGAHHATSHPRPPTKPVNIPRE